MKILTVGSDQKIFKEGSEVRARIIEYGTLFDELHVVIFSSEDNKSIQKIGPNIFVYSTNSLSRWFYVWDAIKVGKKILAGDSMVKNWILTAQDPFESGLVTYKLAKQFSLRFQLQIHTDFLSPFFSKGSWLNRIRLLIANRIIPHADGLRVVSERIKQSLVRQFKIDASKITVLSIFVDFMKIRNNPAAVDLHKKYSQFEKIILMGTRLSPEKNVGFAIDVFSDVIRKFTKSGLVIVGDGPEMAKLESKIKNYRLEGRVILEGFQDKKILYAYYKTADVFLQTSLYEGYGMALIEALVSGMRAVSSDVGVARELNLSEELLAICPVNDRNYFVNKLLELLEEEVLKGETVAKPRIDFEKRFALNKSEYLAKYQKALLLL